MPSKIVIFLTTTLIFILSVPHTIAIRNGLLYLLFIFLSFIVWKDRKKVKEFFEKSGIKTIYILLGIVSLWILFNTIAISHEIKWSLDEFRGQWMTPLLYVACGSMLGLLTFKEKVITKEVLITAVFYAIFIHILYVDLVAAHKYLHTKSLISRYGGLTDSPVLANYLTNILLAFIVSEFVYRNRTKKRILQINPGLLFVIFGAVVFSSLVEGMRNGSVAVVFLGTMGVIFFLYNNKNYSKKIKTILSFVIIISLSVPIIYNLKKDTRWKTLIDTIPIAMDTKANKHWLNKKKYKIPKLENGKDVSGSNYLRVAYAYEGSKLIIENPMGIGFGRNAFGHGLEMKYGEGRGKHSHSSVIDFTIGVGIPGLIIWLAFIFMIIKTSIKLFKENIGYFSMLTFFLTTGFVTRSLVDSNMRDHMFAQFMILFGISLVLMFKEKGNIKVEKDQLHKSQ